MPTSALLALVSAWLLIFLIFFFFWNNISSKKGSRLGRCSGFPVRRRAVAVVNRRPWQRQPRISLGLQVGAPLILSSWPLLLVLPGLLFPLGLCFGFSRVSESLGGFWGRHLPAPEKPRFMESTSRSSRGFDDEDDDDEEFGRREGSSSHKGLFFSFPLLSGFKFSFFPFFFFSPPRLLDACHGSKLAVWLKVG